MLREYEITVITNSQLPEEDAKKLFEKYEGLFFAKGGELIKKSDWGTKKLAFPIKSQFRGRYTNYDLTAHSDQITEAERLMRIDDHVLRYLSVRIGENVDVEMRKKELAKQEAEALAREEKRNKLEP